MSEYISRLNKKLLGTAFNIFKKDIVFTIAFILAAASCFVYTPKLEYIDFKVLFSLFNLMLVVKACEELKILDKVAISIVNKCSTLRKVSLVLILLCFFSSMLITNDVALITFVP
jgi:Na+/H+ antiporter NhaD/arsenite permease-like protein